jgi:hypothetical protein
MMKKTLLWAAVICLVLCNVPDRLIAQDKKDALERAIRDCIEKTGKEYVKAKNKILQSHELVKKLRQFKPSTYQEEWIKRMCLGWVENKELYGRLYQGFVTDGETIRRYRMPCLPDDVRWAKASAAYKKRLIPFAVECLWKVGPDWFGYKCWRQAACLKYLLLIGDTLVTLPIVEVLEIKPPDMSDEQKARQFRYLSGKALAHAKKVEASIVPLRIELVVKFGNKGTVEGLEAKIKEREQAGLSTKHLKEALKKLQERLEKEKQQKKEEPGSHKQEGGSKKAEQESETGSDNNGENKDSNQGSRAEKPTVPSGADSVPQQTGPSGEFLTIALVVLGVVIAGLVVFMLLNRKHRV